MENEKGPIRVDAEPVPEAGDLIRQGESLVRIENQTQMVIAVQRPRDEAAIMKEIRTELKTYPEMADEAIYSKPVGKGQGGKMTYAEGLSIRAAESLAYRWGNNGFGASIEADDGEIVKGVAVFLDYEKNTRRTIPFTVPRKFRKRDGTMARHSEDRFFDIVVPAKQSKALREVILRSIAPGLKKEYEKLAREILNSSGQDRTGPMLRKFTTLGVSQEDIEKLAGKAIEAFKPEDFGQMLGVYNSIMDGDTTVAEAFGRETAEKGKTVSVDQILNGGKGQGLQEGKKPEPHGVKVDKDLTDVWECSHCGETGPGGMEGFKAHKCLPPQKEEEKPKPKKRGRPKGSKNKKKKSGTMETPPTIKLWNLCKRIAAKENPSLTVESELIEPAEKILINLTGEADMGKIPTEDFPGLIEKLDKRLAE